MTNVVIYTDNKNNYRGFLSSGHSGYASSGEDIVCAGISVLVINTVNAINEFTDDDIKVNSDEKLGEISLEFSAIPSEKSVLLIKTMILGLKGIIDNYGNDYITLDYEEV